MTTMIQMKVLKHIQKVIKVIGFIFLLVINSHNKGNLQFYRGVVPRNAIIIKDNVFGISIANLHLEGGRFVDLELDDDTFQIYLDIKLGLLKEVLKLSPDIILGDFNSVYCNDQILLHLWTFKTPILVFVILVFSYLIFLNIFGLSIICSF